MYSNRICTKSPMERSRDRPVGKTKLREGNVFTDVCLSTGWGSNLWFQVLSWEGTQGGGGLGIPGGRYT